MQNKPSTCRPDRGVGAVRYCTVVTTIGMYRSVGWAYRSVWTRGQALSTFKRDASTNQRMGLDVDVTGRYLMTGSRDSRALVYDLTTGECISTLTDVDAVNDVAFHPYAPVVALGTGQRHFDLHTAAPGDE